MIRLKTLHIILLLLLLTRNVFGKISKEVKLERFDFCDTDGELYFKMEESALYVDAYGAHINAKLTFLKDLNSNTLRVEIAISRCANKEFLDSCEQFIVLKPPGVCSLLNLKGVAWDTITARAIPPIRCPLKKGTHVIKNATFDANVFNMYPMEGYYWRIKANIFEGFKRITAFCFDLSVYEKRY